MGLRLTEEEYYNILQKRKDERSSKAEAVSIRNGNSLQRGQIFEELIKMQCRKYRKDGVAVIHKTPEPFTVLRRDKTGLFSGRFTGDKAQPDFQGTLPGGRSVIFEAKSTSKDRILISVLTEKQTELLREHDSYGALCAILCEIGDRRFAVPYNVWTDAKELVGHKFFTADELHSLGTEVGLGIYPFLEVLLNYDDIRRTIN